MEELLMLLKQNALESPANLARQLGLTEGEVRRRIQAYEEKGIIRGYQAIVDEERLGVERVHAVIEVRITPEREGGFDRLAWRISRFEPVESVYLMSGGYDLLVFVSGQSLREVAAFVTEKLATMEGVISTATHFQLKTYKERGFLMEKREQNERLSVSP